MDQTVHAKQYSKRVILRLAGHDVIKSLADVLDAGVVTQHIWVQVLTKKIYIN